MNKDAIFKNIYTDYQVEGKKKTITYSEPSSSIADKDCQAEQEKTNGINNLEMHQKEKIDNQLATRMIISEFIMRKAIKAAGTQEQTPTFGKGLMML